MWWDKSYVNRRDWILENLSVLDLESEEIIILLMIDLYNSLHRPIELSSFAEACNMSVQEMDKRIAELSQKGILKVKPEKDRISFSIDALFRKNAQYEHIEEDIFQTFEMEFGRLLSQNELWMLNQWLAEYRQEEILEALRQAIIYQKLSMNYINAILNNRRMEEGS